MKSGGGLVVNAVCSLSSRLRPCLKDIHREGSTGSGATRNGSGGGWAVGRVGWMDGRKKKEGRLEGLSVAKGLQQPD